MPHLTCVLSVNNHLPVSTNFLNNGWNLIRLVPLNSSGRAGLNGGMQGAIGAGLKDLVIFTNIVPRTYFS